jgi:hypothetical protein
MYYHKVTVYNIARTVRFQRQCRESEAGPPNSCVGGGD